MRKIQKREEDAADKWLRENDPYYTEKGSGKMKYLRHPYLTPDQELQRRRKEIPISSFRDRDLDYFSVNSS